MTVVDLRERWAQGRLGGVIPTPRRAAEAVASPVGRELYRTRGRSLPIWRMLVGDAVIALLVAGTLVLLRGQPIAAAVGVLAIVWLLMLRLAGSYDRKLRRTSAQTNGAVLKAGGWTLASVALLAVPVASLPVADLAGVTVALVAMTGVTRRALERPLLGPGLEAQKVLVRGPGADVSEYLARHARDTGSRFLPVAVQVTDDRPITGLPEGCSVLPGEADTVATMLGSGAESLLLVGRQPEDSTDLRRLIWRLERRDAATFVIPFVAEMSTPDLVSWTGSGLPVLAFTGRDLGGESGVTKVFVDRVLALGALILLTPVIAATAIAVRLTSPGPVLFRQVRVGHGGREFQMLKFRTMVCDAEDQLEQLETLNRHEGGTLFKLEADPRLTRVGRILRKYSLDELPQLVNVLRGEMSLVGPRPPLPREVANYPIDANRRFCLRPGLTGLWQVSGRSDLDPEESMRLDILYVERWSPGLDARILARTPRAVLSGKGAY